MAEFSSRWVMSDLVREYGWAAHDAVHRFFLHQLAVLYAEHETEAGRAVAVCVLRRNILDHLRFEETHVMPRFLPMAEHVPANAQPAEFRGDHEALRNQLRRLSDLSMVAAGRMLDPAVIRLELASLDETLDHHDQREISYLYPTLRARLSAEDQRQLLETMAEVACIDFEDFRKHEENRLQSPALRELWNCYRIWCRAPHDCVVPPLPVAARDLPGKLGERLEALRARDHRMIEAWQRNPPESLRETALASRRVELTLRSTVEFALNAVIDSYLECLSAAR